MYVDAATSVVRGLHPGPTKTQVDGAEFLTALLLRVGDNNHSKNRVCPRVDFGEVSHGQNPLYWYRKMMQPPAP